MDEKIQKSENGVDCKLLDVQEDTGSGREEAVPITVLAGSPDTGWAWIILIGGFISMLLSTLTSRSYSVVFRPYFEREAVSSTFVAWVFSIMVFFSNFTILFVGPLCAQFGWRKIAIVSSIMNALSSILTIFAPSQNYLFFSYSFLAGFGSGAGGAVSMVVTSKYFKKRRGFALTIMACGTCIATFLGPLLSRHLQTEYGFKGSLLILGGFLLNGCVSGALFRPIKSPVKLSQLLRSHSMQTPTEKSNLARQTADKELRKNALLNLQRSRRTSLASDYSLASSILTLNETSTNSFSREMRRRRSTLVIHIKEPAKTLAISLIQVCKRTLKDVSYLKNLRVLTIALASAFMKIGISLYSVWIVFAILDAGHEHKVVIVGFTASAICNFLTRIALSFIVDKSSFPKRLVYISGTLLLFASIIGFTFIDDATMITVMFCINGIGNGGAFVLDPLIMIATMGVEFFPTVFGNSSLFLSFFFLISGPLTGFLHDLTNDYAVTLRAIAGLILLSTLLLILMPCAEAFDKRRENKIRETKTLDIVS